MFTTAAQSPEGPGQKSPLPGLPWPVVGPQLVCNRPKEAAATSEHQSGGGSPEDARQQFHALQYFHMRSRDTPEFSHQRLSSLQTTPGHTDGGWRPLAVEVPKALFRRACRLQGQELLPSGRTVHVRGPRGARPEQNWEARRTSRQAPVPPSAPPQRLPIFPQVPDPKSHFLATPLTACSEKFTKGAKFTL